MFIRCAVVVYREKTCCVQVIARTLR